MTLILTISHCVDHSEGIALASLYRAKLLQMHRGQSRFSFEIRDVTQAKLECQSSTVANSWSVMLWLNNANSYFAELQVPFRVWQSGAFALLSSRFRFTLITQGMTEYYVALMHHASTITRVQPILTSHASPNMSPCIDLVSYKHVPPCVVIAYNDYVM